MSPLDHVRRQQHDVLSRRQLDDLGVGSDQVAREVAARRWQVVGPLVVVLHNGPLASAQRRWAAVLSGGVLAAATALEDYGLVGYEPDDIHVVIRRGAKMPRLPGVVVHESRRLRDGDVHPLRAPATVRVERAVIDTAVLGAH